LFDEGCAAQAAENFNEEDDEWLEFSVSEEDMHLLESDMFPSIAQLNAQLFKSSGPVDFIVPPGVQLARGRRSSSRDRIENMKDENIGLEDGVDNTPSQPSPQVSE